VQPAAERDHRERAARLLERGAGRPRAARLVVLVDGTQRPPSFSPPTVAADQEKPPVDDAGRGMVSGRREGRQRLPGVGSRIVALDRAHSFAIRPEAADHEDASIELGDSHLLTRARHRRKYDPLPRALDVDWRDRISRPGKTAAKHQPDEAEGDTHG